MLIKIATHAQCLFYHHGWGISRCCGGGAALVKLVSALATYLIDRQENIRRGFGT